MLIPYLNASYSAARLRTMPRLAQGQCSDLKIDTGKFRVWLDRGSKADYDGEVPGHWPLSFEKLVDGRWVSCDAHGNPL